MNAVEILLLGETDGPGHGCKPVGKTGSIERRAEENDAAYGIENNAEVSLVRYTRKEQGLPQVLAKTREPKRQHTSLLTSPPKL